MPDDERFSIIAKLEITDCIAKIWATWSFFNVGLICVEVEGQCNR